MGELWCGEEGADEVGYCSVVEVAVVSDFDGVAAQHCGQGVAGVVVLIGDEAGFHVAVLTRGGKDECAVVVEDHFGVVLFACEHVGEVFCAGDGHGGAGSAEQMNTEEDEERGRYTEEIRRRDFYLEEKRWCTSMGVS